MTDNEIIKALEYCFTNDFGKTNCNKCAFYTATAKCMDDMQNATIALINRQKAEIERLNAKIAANDNINYYNIAQLRIAREKLNKYPIKTVVNNNCEIHSKTSKDYDNLMADIKSEAIKEFAERLKSEYEDEKQGRYIDWLMSDIIDNLVKEMTEEDNG